MNILQGIRNSYVAKAISVTLALITLEPWTAASALKASAGGPAQPEYSSFTAVSASNLVDPFTGNVGYAVPLFEIGGYPVTLSYSGDIGMEQDAGWVGLGWSLNVGSINRGLRGVPDEFNGTDKIKQTENLRPRVSVKLGFNKTLLEVSTTKAEGSEDSIRTEKRSNMGLSLTYDNYTGLGIGASGSTPFTDKYKLSKSYDTSYYIKESAEIAKMPPGDFQILPKVLESWKSNYTGGSSFQMNFDYDSKSGLNTNMSLEGVHKKSKLLQSIGTVIGLPKNISLNSRSGKIASGITYGYSNSKWGITFSPDFVVNPSFITPISRTFNYSYTGSFEFTQPTAGVNKRTISLRADVTGSYLKNSISEFPMYGLLYMKGNPDILVNEGGNYNTPVYDVQEQPKYVDKYSTELSSSAVYADVFSISGAGIGGGFRLQDNALVMHGPGSEKSNPTMNSAYLKTELGFMGVSTEIGADAGATINRETYGPLSSADFENDQNYLDQSNFQSNVNNPYQPTAFKNDFEFIEVNRGYYNGFHWDTLSYIGVRDHFKLLKPKDLQIHTKFKNKIQGVTNRKDSKSQAFDINNTIYNPNREARQQVVTYLNSKEAKVHGFQKKIVSYAPQISGVNNMVQGPDQNFTFVIYDTDRYGATSFRKEHHISEFTVLQPDGSRYYYGTPVYNSVQNEYEFSVSDHLLPWQQNGNINVYNYTEGTTGYAGVDNSTSNKKGIDHIYKKKEIPPYAHTYLLNSVLSSDYVDKTSNGPSQDDIGNYVKFNYSQTVGTLDGTGNGSSEFTWRSLSKTNTADLSISNKSDVQDDKAGFSYGAKELWYLHSIETKDQIALFYLKKRLDGYEILNENGGVNFTGDQQYYLDHIKVFSMEEFKRNGAFMGEPLKVIHLQYSYDLCRNYDYNINKISPLYNPDNLAHPITGNTADFNRGGKLTLHKIWVTYGLQQIPTSAPYVFEYNTLNPNYSYKAMDRWGSYKAQITGANSIQSLTSTDFPYTVQDASVSAANTSAWMLSDIMLPSGGKISIEYESDSYGYVQDQEAMKMLKITAITDAIGYTSGNSENNKLYTGKEKFTMSKPKRVYLVVEKPTGVSDINDIVDKDELMYYNFMVQLGRDGLSGAEGTYEEINGFFEIESVGEINSQYSYIKMKYEMAGLWATSPIVRNSLQQGLARAPFIFYPGSDLMRSNHTSLSNKFISMLTGAFTESVSMLINKYQYFITRNFCQEVDLNRSFIRTKCAGSTKYGGGHRVKSVSITDNWQGMTGGIENSASYIIDYTYNNLDGNTSGVASYEPMIGGDENPLKYPKVAYKKKVLSKKVKEVQKKKETQGIHPANVSYDLGPVGEEYFPSPVVGYGRVTIKTRYPNTNIKKHKTGYTVQEFYTAKDFPIFSEASILEKRQSALAGPNIKGAGGKKGKLVHWKLQVDASADLKYSVASQGFRIELNDMHGKPKSNLVYTEDSNEPFSGSRYHYKVDGNGNLENKVTVIRENGKVEDIQAGLSIEPILFGSKSKKTTHSIRPNIDVDQVGTVPILGMYLGYAIEKQHARAVSFTKVIRRIGIVDSVEVYDKGARTSTKNLAWDALTGQVILTSVRNEYGDNVYSLTKPAHWMYKGIQGAYQNIDMQVSISALINEDDCVNPGGYLYPGDELVSTNLSITDKYWVLDRNDATGRVSIIDAGGNNLTPGNYTFRIIRSGFRNILGAGAESITLKSLPIAIVNNQRIMKIPVDQVIAGKGITFDDHRQLYRSFKMCYSVACPVDEGGEPYPDVREAIISSKSLCTVPAGNEIVCMGGGYTTGIPANPFILGIAGVWKPYGDYAYHDKRNQYALRTQSEASGVYDPNKTNTRTDGLIKNYREFWYRNEYGWFCRMEKDTANPWTWTETLQHTDELGNHVQTVNALDVYSTALYGYNDRRLVVAAGVNAQHKELLTENFEDINSNSFLKWVCDNGILQLTGNTPSFDKDFCGPVRHWPVAQLLIKSDNAISTEYSHTGWKSLKLMAGTHDVRLLDYSTNPTAFQDYITSYVLEDRDFIDRFKPTINKEYIISMWVKENVRSQFEFKINDGGSSFVPTSEGTSIIINGWKKLTFRFTPQSSNFSFLFLNHGAPGLPPEKQPCYLDDIRVHPADGAMQAFVYDWRNYRLMSTLDDNNFAVFFEYDEEGTLVRKKVETERGIMTIDENRNSLKR